MCVKEGLCVPIRDKFQLLTVVTSSDAHSTIFQRHPKGGMSPLLTHLVTSSLTLCYVLMCHDLPVGDPKPRQS